MYHKGSTKINYIAHLNAVFEQFSKDGRLNPTHISLYMALFQLWNFHFFREQFHIDREEAMNLSKIGSKSTYHRCIKQLHHWKYLRYIPSHNPFRGSRIRMFNFEKCSEAMMDSNHTKYGTSIEQGLPLYHLENGTSDEQALVSKDKPLQTLKNKTNPNKKRKFKKRIFPDLEKNAKQPGSVPYVDRLGASENKDYDQPL